MAFVMKFRFLRICNVGYLHITPVVKSYSYLTYTKSAMQEAKIKFSRVPVVYKILQKHLHSLY